MVTKYYFLTIEPYSFVIFDSNIFTSSSLVLSIFINFCSSKNDKHSSDSSINKLRIEIDFLKKKN